MADDDEAIKQNIRKSLHNFCEKSIDQCYIVEQGIGEGSEGTVHKCRRKSDNKVVAVKTLFPIGEVAEAFDILDASSKICKLSHPHLLRSYETFYEICQDLQITVHIEMDYYAQGTMRDKLEQEDLGKLPPRYLVRITLQVSKALKYLHNQNMVHRDLKWSNIFLSEGNAVIGDLGRLRTVSETTMSLAGTPTTVAPEIMQGVKTYTNKVDIFSLGVMLYELMTFKMRIFFNELIMDEKATLKGIITDIVDHGYDEAWIRLVVDMVRLKPLKRPTIDNVIDRLQNIVQSLSFCALVVGANQTGKSTLTKYFDKQYYLKPDGMIQADVMRTSYHLCKYLQEDVDFTNIVVTSKLIALIEPELPYINFDGENKFTTQIADLIDQLYADPYVLSTLPIFMKKLHIHDGFLFIIQTMLGKLRTLHYHPTFLEKLYMYTVTSGIQSHKLPLENAKGFICDVGGSRPRRKQWIYALRTAQAFIFVAAAHEYELNCWEDDTTNRMQESLTLFGELVNHFNSLPFIVVLNKCDLLSQQLSKQDRLVELYPEYTGGQNVNNALEFIRAQYLGKVTINPTRVSFVYCSLLDTEKMKQFVPWFKQRVDRYETFTDVDMR